MTLDTTRLDSMALAELQALPPTLLRGLPLATMLTVRLPGDVQAGFVVVDGLGEIAKAGQLGVATFASDEVEALACAVEYGRADAVDLVGWIARKRCDPTFHLDLSTALHGVAAPTSTDGAPRWSLGRVLRELRAVIVNGVLVERAPFVFQRAA